MKITKTKLKQIIMEELANEGVVDMMGDPLEGEPDEETIITGPDDRHDTEARDIISLDNTGYQGGF